jgi:hypothetical protein
MLTTMAEMMAQNKLHSFSAVEFFSGKTTGSFVGIIFDRGLS